MCADFCCRGAVDRKIRGDVIYLTKSIKRSQEIHHSFICNVNFLNYSLCSRLCWLPWRCFCLTDLNEVLWSRESFRTARYLRPLEVPPTREPISAAIGKGIGIAFRGANSSGHQGVITGGIAVHGRKYLAPSALPCLPRVSIGDTRNIFMIMIMTPR